jgi:tRNA (cytidine56-2'-O)-methyltransferase
MITVLRIGHRPERDKRITTHIGLVARAFSSERLLIDTKDTELENTLSGVISRFGGTFKVESGVKWRPVVRSWKGTIIHLTMYGEHVDNVIEEIKNKKDSNLLIIVGATKVPREIYDLAEFNIAIGHQPHSEVAALAIFLDRYFDGSELKKDFGGKLKIIGTNKGKLVVDTDSESGTTKE